MEFKEEKNRINNQSSLILENIKEGFLALDQRLRLVYMNRAAKRLLFVDSSGIIGKTLAEAFKEAETTDLHEACASVLKDRTGRLIRLQWTGKTKAPMFEFKITPCPEGIFVFFHAISPEHPVFFYQEVADNFRQFSDNLPRGVIFRFDRDLRYVYAAGRGLEGIGLKSDEIEGRTIGEVFTGHAGGQA